MPNYFHISPVIFDKKIFLSFPFGCMATNFNLWTTLIEDHPRIIPVKFGEILSSSLGDV